MPVIPEDPQSFPAKETSNKGTDSQPGSSNKATMQDHLSKGPQIPDNMPPKASREEIEARMKELNK
ncbi:hypothetical protein BDW42DRAFT_190284 [Aspergillus taichungensis]|uniref:Uncharacterized protein n=1 Tax=Aspergillus taichungensis TaxID=482145 RepID=A0A2J5I7S1_9EURO|nr:hypothetical protein BDW42DRAFT_190284 [Aspergillus taichungensis]